MKRKEELLVDCTIKAIQKRLETTLENIKIQKGVMLWDDEEKIEHCIIALSILQEEFRRLKVLSKEIEVRLKHSGLVSLDEITHHI